MTLQALYFVPGVCKVNSDYAGWGQFGFVSGRYAKGRFKDMNGARFVAGFPEKLGGFAATGATVTGVPRGMRDWRDNSQVVRLGIGTNLKLFYYFLGALTDITPWRAILTGSLTNPLSSTDGSAVVSVAHTAHGLVTGDYVMLTASGTVGGISVGGVYPITVTDANDYTITTNQTATSTDVSDGGTVDYTYYRVTLSGPFTTVNGSKTVTVAHTANGASVGDFVTISGASAVGGLTLSGEYEIVTASTNSYTITAASAATSSTSGGGTPNFQYDISAGFQDSAEAFGYGTGGYGTNGYGTTGSTGVLLTARVWFLAPYGQQLLCCPSGGTIYIWDPTIGGRAYPLYNAPPMVLAMFVTPERYVVALGLLGTGAGGMSLAWPDQVDYTQWTATAENTANQRDLSGGDYFVGGVPVQYGVSLISSNTTVFVMTYTGDTEIYDTVPTATLAGFIGPLAATVMGGIAYWMGSNDFWTWNGQTAPLPSDDIRDYVFRNINLLQAAKFFARTISAKKEVWFFYCSAAATEIDSYVIFHTDQQCWSIGTLQRTAAIDLGLYPNPMSGDASGVIYDDETGTDANGSSLDAYVTFAPLELDGGNHWMDYFAFEPDFERQSGAITLNVLTRTYPNDSDTVDGPYTISPSDATPRIDLRGSAKMIGFKMESNVVGGDFRLGLQRIEAQPGAARR